jgi:hypothetical protein
LLNPNNVGVAVEIPLPAIIQDLQSELRVFPVSSPPFHFRLNTVGFLPGVILSAAAVASAKISAAILHSSPYAFESTKYIECSF